LTVKTTKTRGEDIRAGQFIAIEVDSGGQRIYRVLRNERDRRGGGGGAIQFMGSDKGIWWRGYQGYDWLELVAR